MGAMADHWKQKPFTFDYNWNGKDEISLGYEFDVHSYVTELMARMREIEDQAGELVVIEWLRNRGYVVDKEENDG